MNRAEAKLRQYQDAIDASNIVSKTDINGDITFVNDEFCKISGYTKKELIGASHSIVRHPDVSPDIFRKLWKTILNKKVYKGIIKNKAKDGSAFYLNATIIPILDESGNIEEFVAIRHDVTNVVMLNERLLKLKNDLKSLNNSLEEKVAEQTKELMELNKGLKKRIIEEVKKNEDQNKIIFQQSRLASMGEMIGNIAHQWRQPLNELGIDLFKMKQNFDNKENFVDIYEHAKIVIKNMSKTIDDFRNFFNSNKPKELFLISESVDDIIVMFKGTLERENINLNVIISNELKIFGYKSELTQVFMNLVSNARDAFKNLDIGKKIIEIKISRKDKSALINIKNNADKIKPEIIDKIFEPYFTTKHPSIGTGLGLYMSKMIIENMGGTMCVKNLKNGVNFQIKIPIQKEKNDE